MPDWSIVLDAQALNKLMAQEFTGKDSAPGPVVSVEPGRISVVAPYSPGMLRPGELIAGPVMMSLADTAAYSLILAHVGPELMAVTSALNINFLRGARKGDVHADAQLLTLGRRNAVCDVRIWTESPDRPAAQATVTYARARAEA